MIEIYTWDPENDEYVFEFRFNDDGTVDGSTVLADTIRNTINNMNLTPADHADSIQAVIKWRYTGPLRGAVIE